VSIGRRDPRCRGRRPIRGGAHERRVTHRSVRSSLMVGETAHLRGFVARCGVKWLTLGDCGGQSGASWGVEDVSRAPTGVVVPRRFDVVTVAPRRRSPGREQRRTRAITAVDGTYFVGAHERQLDPKGRLALPAAFRRRLEPVCYLTLGQDQCVDVLTAADFEADAIEMLARVRRGEMSRDEMRAKAARTVEVRVDGQGRINVYEKLRDYAGLELDAAVVVAGAYDRLEIWRPDRFEHMSSEGTSAMAGGS
jgi:MraZ protein